jgi:hypothetical protein
MTGGYKKKYVLPYYVKKNPIVNNIMKGLVAMLLIPNLLG